MYIIKIFSDLQEYRNDKINKLIDENTINECDTFLSYHNNSGCWIKVNAIESAYVFKTKKEADKFIKDCNDSKDTVDNLTGIFWYLNGFYFSIHEIDKKKLNNLMNNSIDAKIKLLTEEYNKEKLVLEMKRDKLNT